jgi:hypothetical protein
MNNITVIRTKRKTISIKVNNDLTVTVRAPIFTSDKEIGEILKSKEKWISKCIEQIKRENEELSKIDYFTAEEISFGNAGQISPGYSTPWAAPGIPFKAVKWMFQHHAPLAINIDGSMWQLNWMAQMLKNCNPQSYAINKERMTRVAEYSRDCLRELRKETGIHYENRAKGTLQVFRNEAQLDAVQRDIQVLKECGVDYELLLKDDLAKVEPALAYAKDKLVGGLHLPNDETGDCYLFTNALANLAKDMGEDVYLGLMHIEKLEAKIAQFIPEERQKNGEYTSLENFIKRVPIGIETLQILIFCGAFRFTGKQKNELLIEARLIMVNFKPQNRYLSFFEEPRKDYQLPQLKRNLFEDAFDEIEILGFPVSCSPFDLLATKFRGDVMAKDLLKFHKKQVRMLAYLISRKHVPTKKGTMYFGTWIDSDGEYFDTAHFPDNLKNYPFQGGGCYLLLGLVEVDFHFPTITILKMAKMPFIPDPRYSLDSGKSYEIHQKINEDVSMTWRKPYPQEHEIVLPRRKMS